MNKVWVVTGKEPNSLFSYSILSVFDTQKAAEKFVKDIERSRSRALSFMPKSYEQYQLVLSVREWDVEKEEDNDKV